MEASELRRIWTDFFVARGHTNVPSAGLIPHHPSAPMFVNSGMMPFVPYFLGEETPPYTPRRATSVQKCVRLGGKHNDLDDIGRSLRHLSFFEMLGNFSFGDYFKEEAIPWAYEFVTEVLGIDADRVWVTVHTSDDEAEDIWADAVGFPRGRIQRLDKDNFWEMGDTGPCGPSSELFFDFGAEHGPDGGPANPEADRRYVEFWNLVFPQYFRGADGELTDLEAPGIDTGAGFERILGVLADSPSLYVADSVSRLVDTAQSVTGATMGVDDRTDIALRLLADHTRTMAFLVSDGVVPSNEDRGYVLRRVIRRAVRFAYLLGVTKVVTVPLVESCIEIMGDAYPDLRDNRDLVLGICSREEEKFRQTLKTGVTILDEKLGALDQGEPLPGADAFLLHDTYGFPLEVTEEIVADRGTSVDVEGFRTEMAAQRDRARAAGKGAGVATGDEVEAFQAILAEHGPTEFTGRDEASSEAVVLGMVGEVVVLDRTPFYAESGGQVGDSGTLSSVDATVEVVDTTNVLPGLHGHRVVGGSFEVGTTVRATIDEERRARIRRNHTGTHVLHWALREVLGEHVKQQGSLVDDTRLRFDFSHFDPVTDDEIVQIEDLANRLILDNVPVRHYETSKDEATQLGAIAFFGDKYGDRVRVLEAGPSVEFCGGTHVSATGDIGPVKITSESSIGSNLRRIEAVTGTGPIERLRNAEAELAAVAEAVGVPIGEVTDAARRRVEEIKELRSEIKQLRQQQSLGKASDLAAEAVDGVLVTRIDGIDRGALRDLAVAIRDKGVDLVVIGSEPDGGGAALVAAARPESGLDAGALIAPAGALIGGGGRPAPDLSLLGGKNAAGIDDALELVRNALAG